MSQQYHEITPSWASVRLASFGGPLYCQEMSDRNQKYSTHNHDHGPTNTQRACASQSKVQQTATTTRHFQPLRFTGRHTQYLLIVSQQRPNIITSSFHFNQHLPSVVEFQRRVCRSVARSLPQIWRLGLTVIPWCLLMACSWQILFVDDRLHELPRAAATVTQPWRAPPSTSSSPHLTSTR